MKSHSSPLKKNDSLSSKLVSLGSSTGAEKPLENLINYHLKKCLCCYSIHNIRKNVCITGKFFSNI